MKKLFTPFLQLLLISFFATQSFAFNNSSSNSICEIWQVIYDVDPECNDDGTYNVTVDLEYADVSNSFDVLINDEFFGTYLYVDLPITLVIESNHSGNFDTFEAIDSGDPNCLIAYEWPKPDCALECLLLDLIIENYDCENGEFLVDLDFYHEGASDSFNVVGNGTDYGTFAYDDLYITLGPFDGDGSTVYEFIVTDSEDDGCAIEGEIGPIECPQCELSNLSTEVSDCDDNGNYSLTFDLDYENVDSDFFEVWINNEYIGSFEWGELPLTIDDITPRSNTNYDIIEVCVNDNDACCIDLEYNQPDCGDDEECNLSNLELEIGDCNDDGNYSLTFDLDYENVDNDFFDLWINGEYIGFFEWSDLPLTVDNITPRQNSDYDLIEICVNDNPNCCIIEEYMPPECDGGGDECELSDLEIEVGDCDADGTYCITFDFTYENTVGDFFEVWINNEYINSYLFDDLPITICEIEPQTGTDYDFLKICVNDAPDCCLIEEYIHCAGEGDDCVGDIEVEVGDCNDEGEYCLTFDVQNRNQALDVFDLWINNEFIGSYSVDDLPLTICEIEPRSNSLYDIIRICLNDEPDCCSEYEYNQPDCGDGTDECELSGLEVEVGDCNDDGLYCLTFSFEYENTNNDFFDLWINNEFLGTYSLGTLPLTICDIEPRANSDYDIIRVCINDNDDCCAVYEYNQPNCGDDDECEISALEVEVGDCNDDGLYCLTFDFDHQNTDSDSFDLWINNELLGTYSLDTLPLTICEIEPRANSDYDIIRVCINDNNDCCALYEYNQPDCGDDDECEISALEVEVGDCNDDGLYCLTFDFDHQNTDNDSFDLWINNELLGTYSLDTLPLTICEIEPRANSDYDIIRVCINDNNDCCALYEYNQPDCGDNGDDCELSNLEFEIGPCDDDDNYSLTFNLEYQNPGNDLFEVWINNEYHGFHPWSALPLTVDGITPRPDSDYDIIKVCVNDMPDCCIEVEYMQPNCSDLHDDPVIIVTTDPDDHYIDMTFDMNFVGSILLVDVTGKIWSQLEIQEAKPLVKIRRNGLRGLGIIYISNSKFRESKKIFLD